MDDISASLPNVYLTNDEAAEFIRQSPRTLEKWRSEGRGPAYIPGRPVAYLLADLEAWKLARRTIPTNTKSGGAES